MDLCDTKIYQYKNLQFMKLKRNPNLAAQDFK